MRRTVAELTDSLIDYAGTFPPGNLSLVDALNAYRAMNGKENEKFVSRFCVRTTDLAELGNWLREGDEIPVSAIAAPSHDKESWEDALEADAKRMNDFMDAAGDRAEIEAFETKLYDLSAVESCVQDLSGFQEAEVFVELPWGAGMDDALNALAESGFPGAKARCGGEYTPSTAQLAAFINGCLSLDQPFKLTAGLHEPFFNGKSHGFLAIGAAVAFELVEELGEKRLAEALEADDFEFTDDAINWRGATVDFNAVEDARGFFVSFGSCSVDDPVKALVKRGLLR
ncbi:hypothetical protein EON81_05225 [bacterium]|nr:MAG: hypothetical protein EON81_05225 [bacterium]